MWVEPHDNEVAADKQVKHNTAWTGEKIALGAVGEHCTQEAKNETTVKLTWHELKITSAIFSQMVNTAILCDPKRIVVKFPHSPILHYAFSSWMEKTMT